MTDIFQEVEQDLRREQASRLWSRYGIYILALAVLVVVVVGGWSAWDAVQTQRARAAGDAFTTALDEVDGVGTASAADTLLAYAAEAPEGYAMLARFRAATVFSEADEPARAAEVLRGLADDGAVAGLYRDAARVRLASVLIDSGDTAGAEGAVAAIAEDAANPFNAAAQEMMGLAAYANGDREAARRWFGAIDETAGASPEIQQRARLMLGLLDQIGAPAAADTTGTAGETE
jgi:hypothetical protein